MFFFTKNHQDKNLDIFGDFFLKTVFYYYIFVGVRSYEQIINLSKDNSLFLIFGADIW